MSQLFIYLPQFFYYLSVVMYIGPFFFIFILGHCIYVNSFYDLSFHTFFSLCFPYSAFYYFIAPFIVFIFYTLASEMYIRYLFIFLCIYLFRNIFHFHCFV